MDNFWTALVISAWRGVDFPRYGDAGDNYCVIYGSNITQSIWDFGDYPTDNEGYAAFRTTAREAVVLHELGHLFGLDHPGSGENAGSVMNPGMSPAGFAHDQAVLLYLDSQLNTIQSKSRPN